MSNSRRQEGERTRAELTDRPNLHQVYFRSWHGRPTVGSEDLTWVMAGTAMPRWKLCG